MEQLSIADALDAASDCNPFQSRVATLCEPQTIDPFEATNHHGDPVTVRTDADRAVVYSFPNTDGCRCTAQIQQYDALATELNIPVYGLAPAKPDDLFDVAKRFGVVHDLLSDPHGNIAGKVGIPIDVDSGKHKRTTLFLANGEVVERVDGLTAISVRESDDGIRLDERPPIIDTFEHPSVVTIVGKRGAGKSSTAYYIAEQLNQREGLVPVTVGTPEHARSLFPSHWVHADAIQEAPPNSVVVADEAYRFLHAREWQQNDSVEISKLINLSRQCDRTILFVTQSSKQIDGNVPLESDAVVMKEPGALHSRLERREMRPVIEQADDAFGQLPVDQDSRSYAYVMTDDGAEMVPVGEADFFTDALSNAFGGDCGAFDAGEKHDYDDDDMISNWDRGINIDAAKAKIRNVGLVVIHDRADFPVYDDISTVPNPTEGTRVHCTGKGPQKPAGEWWFDGDKWFSGTRTRVSAQQQKVTANNSVILQEFGLPSNTEINVWQLQATNISGSNTGISIDVRNTTDGNEIAVYDAASEDGTVKIGTPIATGGDGDDIIVVRVVNTTGSAKDVTGFAVISIQSIV